MFFCRMIALWDIWKVSFGVGDHETRKDITSFGVAMENLKKYSVGKLEWGWCFWFFVYLCSLSFQSCLCSRSHQLAFWHVDLPGIYLVHQQSKVKTWCHSSIQKRKCPLRTLIFFPHATFEPTDVSFSQQPKVLEFVLKFQNSRNQWLLQTRQFCINSHLFDLSPRRPCLPNTHTHILLIRTANLKYYTNCDIRPCRWEYFSSVTYSVSSSADGWHRNIGESIRIRGRGLTEISVTATLNSNRMNDELTVNASDGSRSSRTDGAVPLILIWEQQAWIYDRPQDEEKYLHMCRETHKYLMDLWRSGEGERQLFDTFGLSFSTNIPFYPTKKLLLLTQLLKQQRCKQIVCYFTSKCHVF